jgi:hypothetical protein
MTHKTFWGAFALTQLVGSLGLATGNPHGNPFGLLLALIFLFPGSLLCWPILDKLAVHTTTGPVILVSFLINITCWTIFALLLASLRRRKAN